MGEPGASAVQRKPRARVKRKARNPGIKVFLEAVMKGRLGSTIWMLVAFNAIALFGVIVLAYVAGEKSRLPIANALQSDGAAFFLSALVAAVAMAFILFVMLGNRVVKPVKELTDFS